MKKILPFIVLISILSSSCSIFKSNNTDKDKIIGCWSGSEKDNQKEGITKYWIQNRYLDGTFVLMFTTVMDCEVEHFVEKGKWKIENGLFYEIHDDGKTDIYSFEFVDKNHLKFKAQKLGIEHSNNDYEFIDTRVELENSANQKN